MLEQSNFSASIKVVGSSYFNFLDHNRAVDGPVLDKLSGIEVAPVADKVSLEYYTMSPRPTSPRVVHVTEHS